MKVRAWTCGLLAALVGCTSLDRSYDPQRRPTLLGDRTQVPPGSQPTWEQKQTSSLAYRGPGTFGGPTVPYGSGVFGGGPAGSYGSSTPATTGDRYAPVGPGLGQSNPATSTGFPASPPQGVQTAGLGGVTGQSMSSPLSQVGFNDNPISVVPQNGPPAAGASAIDQALSALTATLPAPGTDNPGSDLGSKRRIMQPLSSPDSAAGPPPISGNPPPALLMPKQDKEPEPINPVKHEEKSTMGTRIEAPLNGDAHPAAAPSPNGSNGAGAAGPVAGSGHGADGRFLIGNVGGPGNPHARRTAELQKAFRKAATPERMEQLSEKLFRMALGGDVAAAKVFLAYAVGRPAAATDPDSLDEMEWRRLAGCPNFADVLAVAGLKPFAEALRMLANLVRVITPLMPDDGSGNAAVPTPGQTQGE